MDRPRAFNNRHYVPCLRWKRGEYQALSRLTLKAKWNITPLIEVAEIGWDFETEEEAKTIDEHLALFAKRLHDNWTDKWAFIDLKQISASERMQDGRHPLKFVFDDMENKKAFGIPVTGINRDQAYQAAVIEIISKEENGVCLRISIQDLMKPQFNNDLTSLLKELKLKPEDTDLILDLEAPNFELLEGFTKMVQAVSGKLPYINEWRTYTICGTSFPETMGELDLGVKILKRYEWLFYKEFLKALGPKDRKPTFGDYAISHPKVAKIDMRMAKPAGTLRYAINDAWYIAKGPNVRDYKYAQYFGHSAKLVSSEYFMGEIFSEGDRHIGKCAKKLVKTPGNLTTWRWVGTNHHIEKVVSDFSNLDDS
jgi:hypothetical protein